MNTFVTYTEPEGTVWSFYENRDRDSVTQLLEEMGIFNFRFISEEDFLSSTAINRMTVPH